MTEIPDRSRLYSLLPEGEILARYRKNYKLGAEITMEHVRKHADLEAMLTDQLLAARVDERPVAFRAAYSCLYQDLPWLSGTGASSGAEEWAQLLRKGSRILEVGSGAGYLIRHLARAGFDCTGTELSEERSALTSADQANLRWAHTDGVHLTRYEAPASYDYLLSDQVVEHLHPEDIETHFKEARELLKPGGSYIFRTPHRSAGPADLSLVFGTDTPVFMHLHEFTHEDARIIAHTCGYEPPRAVIRPPKLKIARTSGAYFRYLLLIERVESAVFASQASKRAFRRRAKYLLARHDVWIELRRPR